MDNGFGVSTLILVGLGCGALGYLSGVEEPLLDPDDPNAKPGFSRRSAKKVRQWVRDLKTRRTERKSENTKAHAQAVAAAVMEQPEGVSSILEALAQAAEQMTPEERERAEKIGDIMAQLNERARKEGRP